MDLTDLTGLTDPTDLTMVVMMDQTTMVKAKVQTEKDEKEPMIFAHNIVELRNQLSPKMIDCSAKLLTVSNKTSMLVKGCQNGKGFKLA